MAESAEELDLAKVQDFIRGQVETYAKEVFDRQQPSPVTQQPGQLSPEQQAQRQLQEVITPFIKPSFDAIQLTAADTRDFVDFYSDPSVKEDKERVEKMFEELKNAGRPLPRKDIYDYLEGKLHRENPDEFNKRASARRKVQLDTATGATDFGAGALARVKSDPQYDPKKMSLKDLEEALAGVTF